MAGPIFIALIQMGVERGVRAGMALSAGVLFSDCFYFYLVLQGMEHLANMSSFQFWVGIIGGIILVAFGIYSIFSAYKPPEEIKVTAKTYGGYFFKGMAINIFNPFVFILWTVISQDMIREGFSKNEKLLYFIAIIATVALTDFLKLVLAKSIRPYLKPVHMSRVSKIAGTGLVIFGLILVYRVL